MSAVLKGPSRDETVYVRTIHPSGLDAFSELAAVFVTQPVRTLDGAVIAAGTLGAVVSVWNDGLSYEVEFAEPVGALATVPGEHLRLAEIE